MSAIFYLLILIVVALGLFAIAYFLPKKSSTKDPLAQLLSHTQALLTDTPFTATQEKHYIAIYQAQKRIALLQIDPSSKKPLRHFAGVIIICFHRLPSKKQLYKTLKEHQILTVN